ncbi:glutaredoxin family protein [Bacillus wiedmannii]|uniref:glutaredoxin family protein n=1 Tax=Bacillus wiedmannii TaxID=1890302 RepID=UPI0021CE5C6E|nr:glutaredoxin family protein [Bacillus wiedmannii]MCU5096119.1 glutaredoxin family protein [Bacillus wiedmannii]
MAKTEVILYGSGRCSYCVKAKDWLKEKEIEYKEVSIDTKEGHEEFEPYNSPGVPLIVVKDTENQTEEKIIGFNPDSLSEALLK